MFFSRGKNKVQNVYNLSDMYDSYLEEFKNEEEYLVSNVIFQKISSEYNKAVVDKLLEGKMFKLPFLLGEMEITKRKIKKYFVSNGAIDWKTTLKVGKLVYYLNEHSDGYNYGIDWRPSNRFKRSKYYRFSPIREMKRRLAKIIKNKEQDYYERIDN